MRRSGMPKGGLEPPRPCEHNALNVACLPISPLRLFTFCPFSSSDFPPDLTLDRHYITVSPFTCQVFFSLRCLPTYSNNASSGSGGGRRGTGVDWIMVVVVEPYRRKLSRIRSS